jgi:hypothetical protein
MRLILAADQNGRSCGVEVSPGVSVCEAALGTLAPITRAVAPDSG